MLVDFTKKRFSSLGNYNSKTSVIYEKTYASGFGGGKKLNLYSWLS